VLLSDDQIWTSLQVGNLDEKNTEKIQGGTTFEESISLLIYDLANDKVSLAPVDFLHVGYCVLFPAISYSPIFGRTGAKRKNIVRATED